MEGYQVIFFHNTETSHPACVEWKKFYDTYNCPHTTIGSLSIDNKSYSYEKFKLETLPSLIITKTNDHRYIVRFKGELITCESILLFLTSNNISVNKYHTKLSYGPWNSSTITKDS